MGKEAELKDRLRQAMEEQGLKQSDLIAIGKFDKGQMSAWLSGRYKPKQVNIDKLASILGVSEGWLMGYAIPKERDVQYLPENIEHIERLAEIARDIDSYKEGLRIDEIELIEKYRTLDQYGKDAVTSVLNAEYDRCQDESETVIPIDRETALKLPLELRLKLGKFLTDGDAELRVARRRK